MDDNYIILVKIALNRRYYGRHTINLYIQPSIRFQNQKIALLPGLKEKRQKPSFCDFLPFLRFLFFIF
nr:MAG TPA: hypothetical protein [Caudoviricetes sp.]